MADTAKRKLSASGVLAWCAVIMVVIAGLLVALAGLGSRLGWWHFRTGFAVLKYGAYGGIAASVLALCALILAIRGRRLACLALSSLALIAGVVVAAVPVSWRLKAKQLPAIHDITTDTSNPPQFVAILPLRKNTPNPAGYGGPSVAEQQQKGYPDLRTEVLDMPASEAFQRALEAAKEMGWRIVASDPAEGRIEASDTTFWFGFVDDIVIRVAGAGGRALVDVRSVSRVGKSDVGTNARRIRNYLQRLTSRS